MANTHFDDTKNLKDIELSKEDAVLILTEMRNRITPEYVRAALRIAIHEITTSIENQ